MSCCFNRGDAAMHLQRLVRQKLKERRGSDNNAGSFLLPAFQPSNRVDVLLAESSRKVKSYHWKAHCCQAKEHEMCMSLPGIICSCTFPSRLGCRSHRRRSGTSDLSDTRKKISASIEHCWNIINTVTAPLHF